MSAESFETKRTLTVSEAEESVLVEMVMFFNDMGWINEESQSAYDSLFDKITDPEPSDYSFYDKEHYNGN